MFLKNGSRGSNVRLLQEHLASMGYYDFEIDGMFGPATQAAVLEFQVQNALNADGIVGPRTFKLLGMEKPIPPKIIPVPVGRKEVYRIFGDPLDSGWWQEWGAFCETPKELNHCFTYRWKGMHGFWCNRVLVAKFQRVYRKIVMQGLAQELKTFDGCYNLRYIRGGSKLSTHSWAIAVDHNAEENPLGAEPQIDMGIVAIFEAEGFVWGGRFQRKDSMHVQYAKKM